MKRGRRGLKELERGTTSAGASDSWHSLAPELGRALGNNSCSASCNVIGSLPVTSTFRRGLGGCRVWTPAIGWYWTEGLRRRTAMTMSLHGNYRNMYMTVHKAFSASTPRVRAKAQNASVRIQNAAQPSAKASMQRSAV